METRRQAQLRMDRLDRFGDIGIAQGRRIGIVLRSQVIVFFRQDIPVDEPFGQMADALEGSLLDMMVGSHLQGRLDALLLASDAMRRSSQRKFFANRAERAVGFLARRLELSADELVDLRGTYGPAASDIAKGFSGEVQSRISREMAAITTDGAHVNEGVKRLRGAFDAAGVPSGTVPGHVIETIYRTQTQMAYAAGDWNADQDPVIQEILWGYEYSTVGDNRVRPTHDGLDGTRLPKDDPQWESIRPPNGFNCRCVLLKVFDTDDHKVVEVKDEATVAIAHGGTVKIRPGADNGFSFNPGVVFPDSLVGGRAFMRKQLLKKSKVQKVGKRSKRRRSLDSLKGRDRVLVAIDLLSGEVALKAVVDLAGVTLPTVSEQVASLVKLGLVNHQPMSRYCSLTTEGRARSNRLLADLSE